MRHSRRAVMAEHYKLYMKKNIFNGKYFVRNLQIGICTVAVAVLVSGTFVLTHIRKNENKAAASADVSVKEALFGKSEEENVIVREPDTEEAADTESIANSIEEAVTKIVATEDERTDTQTENREEEENQPENDDSYTEEPVKESGFDGKCIADVDETLNIRKEPSTDAEFVGSMNSGAIAIVEGTEGDWTKIKSGDVEGYVLTEYILMGESAEQFAEDYVTLVGTVLEDGVNVRAEMSTDAEILEVLNKDNTITVLENPEKEESVPENNTIEETAQSSTEDAGITASITEAVDAITELQVEEDQSKPEETVEDTITWVPVMLEDGQTGYISAELVDIDELYQIAVSAEELERRAAEEEAARKAAEEAAAREEAARQAAAQAANSNQTNNTSNNSNNSNSDNSSSYQGATTTPVTATESGECIGTFTVTGYCGCSKCSGHSTTASGTTPTEGRTIAADTGVLPFGTQVVIDGIVYTVEDRGSGVTGNHIDIFFATHEKAMNFGKRTIKVYKY